MHRLTPMTTPSSPQKRQRGITLIESLVAIVVAALGILGIVGVQLRTLTDTQTSVRRAQAIRLIEDIGERTTANPNALASINAYVTGFDATPAVPDCSNGCGPAQLAAYDVAVWKRTVRENLPLGQASIFVPPAESALAAGLGRQLGVMIAWRENERVAKVSDADDADSTSYRGAINASIGGGGVTCRDGFTCHLQYIPVASRCAPYLPGTGAALYYCPGS